MEKEPVAIQSVKDLQDSDKRCLQNLLGRELQENQQIFITAFTAGMVPDEATRRKALAGMQRIQAKAEAHANAHGISEDQIDAAVDEAMEHVRPRTPCYAVDYSGSAWIT
jgi:hypothetical protein